MSATGSPVGNMIHELAIDVPSIEYQDHAWIKAACQILSQTRWMKRLSILASTKHNIAEALHPDCAASALDQLSLFIDGPKAWCNMTAIGRFNHLRDLMIVGDTYEWKQKSKEHPEEPCGAFLDRVVLPSLDTLLWVGVSWSGFFPWLMRSTMSRLEKIGIQCMDDESNDHFIPSLIDFFRRHHPDDVHLSLTEAQYPDILPLLVCSRLELYTATTWHGPSPSLIGQLPPSVHTLEIASDPEGDVLWPVLDRLLEEKETKITNLSVDFFEEPAAFYEPRPHVPATNAAAAIELRNRLETYDENLLDKGIRMVNGERPLRQLIADLDQMIQDDKANAPTHTEKEDYTQ
jgi:hypothetical protein